MESFVAVTAHFINEQVQLKSVLLQFDHFSGRHTAENIADSLKKVAQEWNISNKIVLTITDNATNIAKAVKDILKWKHMGCFAHTINLVVNDALKVDQAVVEVLDKIRKIVGHFKRSAHSTEKLMAYQKNTSGSKEIRKLLQDVPTRWNSTYFMLKRFILLQEPVKATIALLDKDIPILSQHEWKIVCKLMVSLKPFYSVTKSISGEKYATASLVIPLSISLASVCKKLKSKTITKEAQNVVDCLVKGVATRFSNFESSQTLTLVTFLDPRFKNVVFSSPEIGENVKQRVINMITTAIKAEEVMSNIKKKLELDEIIIDEQSDTDDLSIWSDLDGILAKKKKKGTHYSRAIIEVDRYMEEDLQDRRGDPLTWWKENGHQYPHILEIIKKYFCSLATSVPCERTFSKAGLLLSDRRNRLSANKAKMLMFLNQNEPSIHSITPKALTQIKIKDRDDEDEKVQKIVDCILKEN